MQEPTYYLRAICIRLENPNQPLTAELIYRYEGACSERYPYETKSVLIFVAGYFSFWGGVAVVIIAVIWIIVSIIYNRKKRKGTLPYKKSRFRVRIETMRSIAAWFIASLILLLIGGFLWIVYGDNIMNIIDNLRQGKFAGSLSNNTIIGTKNPLDQIIIENLKK